MSRLMTPVEAAAFSTACGVAERLSRDNECTMHVNAVVIVNGFGPAAPTVALSFHASDWYTSEGTVRSYTDGAV